MSKDDRRRDLRNMSRRIFIHRNFSIFFFIWFTTGFLYNTKNAVRSRLVLICSWLISWVRWIEWVEGQISLSNFTYPYWCYKKSRGTFNPALMTILTASVYCPDVPAWLTSHNLVESVWKVRESQMDYHAAALLESIHLRWRVLKVPSE